MKSFNQFKESLDDARIASLEKQRDTQARIKQKSDEYKVSQSEKQSADNDKNELKQEIRNQIEDDKEESKREIKREIKRELGL
jgi:hypothetical protein